jgi:hypothetical protein
MSILLNIGLNIGDQQALGPYDVRHALDKAGVRIIGYVRTCQSDTEKTAVLEVKQITALQAFVVSVSLRQEAIAVFDTATQTGYLEGPDKELWGAFNIEAFKGFEDC